MPSKKGAKSRTKITSVKAEVLIKLFERGGFQVSKKSRKHTVMRKEGHLMNLAIPNHPGSEGVRAGVIQDLIKKAGISREEYFKLPAEI